jgi:hypothetical protein
MPEIKLLVLALPSQAPITLTTAVLTASRVSNVAVDEEEKVNCLQVGQKGSPFRRRKDEGPVVLPSGHRERRSELRHAQRHDAYHGRGREEQEDTPSGGALAQSIADGAGEAVPCADEGIRQGEEREDGELPGHLPRVSRRLKLSIVVVDIVDAGSMASARIASKRFLRCVAHAIMVGISWGHCILTAGAQARV